MTDCDNLSMGTALAVSDLVALKGDALFRDFFDPKKERITKAGTECIVADICHEGGVPYSVIVEYDDSVTNTSWIASLGAEEVKIIQKYSTSKV